MAMKGELRRRSVMGSLPKAKGEPEGKGPGVGMVRLGRVGRRICSSYWVPRERCPALARPPAAAPKPRPPETWAKAPRGCVMNMSILSHRAQSHQTSTKPTLQAIPISLAAHSPMPFKFPPTDDEEEILFAKCKKKKDDHGTKEEPNTPETGGTPPCSKRRHQQTS